MGMEKISSALSDGDYQNTRRVNSSNFAEAVRTLISEQCENIDENEESIVNMDDNDDRLPNSITVCIDRSLWLKIRNISKTYYLTNAQILRKLIKYCLLKKYGNDTESNINDDTDSDYILIDIGANIEYIINITQKAYNCTKQEAKEKIKKWIDKR